MTTRIGTKTFSGAAHVHNGTLADAIRGIVQREALTIAITLDDFTADNSGGSDGSGTVGETALPEGFTSAGIDLFPKAGGETALGTIRDAIAVVLEHANELATAIGADTATDNTGGNVQTAGTIAAITASTTAVAGNSGNGMGAEGAIPVFTDFRNAVSQLVRYVNTLCTATGVDTLTDNSGGDAGVKKLTFDALSTDTGAATADGADLSGIEDTAGEAFLAASANAIATIAAKLDAITGAAQGAPTVVAVD